MMCAYKFKLQVIYLSELFQSPRKFKVDVPRCLITGQIVGPQSCRGYVTSGYIAFLVHNLHLITTYISPEEKVGIKLSTYGRFSTPLLLPLVRGIYRKLDSYWPV